MCKMNKAKCRFCKYFIFAIVSYFSFIRCPRLLLKKNNKEYFLFVCLFVWLVGWLVGFSVYLLYAIDLLITDKVKKEINDKYDK